MSLIVYFNSSVRGYGYVPHCKYGPYGFLSFCFPLILAVPEKVRVRSVTVQI